MADNRISKLYSYVIESDIGFAPNPYDGICSLACCKPALRRSVGGHILRLSAAPDIMLMREQFPNLIREQNIWITAVASRGLSQKNSISYRSLVYMMQVTDILDYASYYKSYPQKRPDRSDPTSWKAVGDNIYTNNDFETARQLSSMHSNNDGTQNVEQMRHDLGGKFVLLSDHFIYFGSNAREVPFADDLKNGRGHQVQGYRAETIAAMECLLNGEWGPYFEKSPAPEVAILRNAKSRCCK